MTSNILVKLDDRVRLMSALLAATPYPDQAQAKRPHGTHVYARSTRKKVAPLADHPAVADLTAILESGAPLEALFSLALTMHYPSMRIAQLPRWVPPHFDEHVLDFFQKAELAQWWIEEAFEWEKAHLDCSHILSKVDLKAFLQPFVGTVPESLVFIPNLSYPTDQELGLRMGDQLFAIVPPRLAWGDNPPWPFDEDPAHVIRAGIEQFGRLLMTPYFRQHAAQMVEISNAPLPVTPQFAALYPTWQEQFTTIFISGIVAIYLEDHVSKKEALSYALMERKVRGLTALPAVISVLRRYLAEKASGRYQTLQEFLPVFPKQLRVANRIVSL